MVKTSAKQADEKTIPLKEGFRDLKMKSIWIKYIRTSLGMKLRNLAERVNLSSSTISEMEKREKSGNITLKTLEKLANAMGCDLVYAFVPKNSFEELVQHRAKSKAVEILDSVNKHMALENQKVKQTEEELDQLVNKFLESGDIW